MNQLTSLPEGIMRLANLDKLWLANNSIKKIPEVL
jgi:Leucine-rich repeat (LRR) protein